jgi:hypothetical protein
MKFIRILLSLSLLLIPAASFGANTAPVANTQSASTAEDKGKVITLAGSDADAGAFLSYTIVTSPANGSLTGTGPTRVYSPNANFNGTDSFTFKVNDGVVDSAVATVSLTITPVAEPAVNGPAFPEFVDPNPSAGNGFGTTIVALNTGNVVITSPQADIGGVTDCGAVYLFNGSTGALISTLRGSSASDQVGGGVTALTNGNYVVRSPSWYNGAVYDAGAVTWGNGTTGISGVVSASNSLVGSKASDYVGIGGVTALTNGNYVVSSSNWDNGAIVNAGAVTWGNGTTGISGVVSASNSLVGSTASDYVGDVGVTAMTNGNYVVRSSSWDNGAVADVGAVIWCNGTTGISGVVSASNSLVGTKANNQVGSNGVTALTNGNYVVVSSSDWANGATGRAGAVTWGNGSTGISGVVSAANSLVGSTASDQVGSSGVTALTNGNYVVRSSNWDNGAIVNAGAVTWGNGTTGISGVVSASNSQIGGVSSTNLGVFVVEPLNNLFATRWAGELKVRLGSQENGFYFGPYPTAITPNTGTFAGGTSVTITGTAFTEATGVTIGGTAATSVTVVSSTSITCTTPVGAVGAQSVLVTTPVGTNSANTLFTYTNSSPTDITLSATGIAENNAANATVGTLGSIDPDPGDTFTYSFASGGADNASFSIAGSTLRLTPSADFETKSSYGIKIRCTDAGGLFFEKSFTITITNVNEAPTALALGATSIAENVVANSTVGTLSTTDVDAANTFTYSLVTGTGSTDNAAFNLSGSSLRITASPDFETQSSYAVRVRTTDQGSLFTEQPFTITITDANDAPTFTGYAAATPYQTAATISLSPSLTPLKISGSCSMGCDF